jgi:hypothetical protein
MVDDDEFGFSHRARFWLGQLGSSFEPLPDR